MKKAFSEIFGDNEEEKHQAAAEVQKDRYKPLFVSIRENGYPVEKHFYETEDSYINCVFRISGPKGTDAKENAK